MAQNDSIALKLTTERRELAKSSELWQCDLLNAWNLRQFANSRGVSIFDEDRIINLWRIGLLRADVIISDDELNLPGIELITKETGRFIYCDQREVERRTEGYGGSLNIQATDLKNPELLFHPFRLYVLYHIQRVFQINVSSTQYLDHPKGLHSIADSHIAHLNRWTSEGQCSERFEYWNRVAELAIVLEPAAYSDVFHSIRWRNLDTEDSIIQKLDAWRKRVKDLVLRESLETINKARDDLCLSAETLDGNKLLHVLLRLMAQQERGKLRGELGACMEFLSMAEIIRRATEHALDMKLSEEDELGFGQWMQGARKSVYGTDRILDSDTETRRDFLNAMGLDYGLKVRCYVEGDTEFAALNSGVGAGAGVEFINLRGQVVEKRGKGLSFIASLKNDLRSHIFSVVALDQDRDDYIRALKAAVTGETFFGRFFIARPDFEFANFTIEELIDVALDLAKNEGNIIPERTEITDLVSGAKSGKQFFAKLSQMSELQNIKKGEAWGIALMQYAVKHQDLPLEHAEAGKKRPIIEMALFLINARRSGYLRTSNKYAVDINTGELRKRNQV